MEMKNKISKDMKVYRNIGLRYCAQLTTFLMKFQFNKKIQHARKKFSLLCQICPNSVGNLLSRVFLKVMNERYESLS